MPVSQPVLNTPGAGESLEYGNGSKAEIIVGGPESGGEYSAVRYTVRPGDEPPLHTHTREDEMVYVVEGEITATVGDTNVDVGPGAFAALPQGIPHTIRVNSESATLILTLVPAGLERFFVPASEEDSDPARYGLLINEPAAEPATA
jgi:quercetin dioxygenase-like cupin family protein